MGEQWNAAEGLDNSNSKLRGHCALIPVVPSEMDGLSGCHPAYRNIGKSPFTQDVNFKKSNITNFAKSLDEVGRMYIIDFVARHER